RSAASESRPTQRPPAGSTACRRESLSSAPRLLRAPAATHARLVEERAERLAQGREARLREVYRSRQRGSAAATTLSRRRRMPSSISAGDRAQNGRRRKRSPP